MRELSKEEVKQLQQWITEGISRKEATERTGFTESQLLDIRRKYGIEGTWKNLYGCVVCGKEFRAAHTSLICESCKETPAKCIVCGKEFKRVHPYTHKTCSRKCAGIYRKESGYGKEIAAKMKKTKMDRYGTLSPAEVAKAKNGGQLDPKICKLCGKEFIPNTSWQVYCTDVHYVPCPVCGKMTELKDRFAGPQACSEECRMKRINATCLERYGNKDAVNSEHAKQLAKQHNLERYGVEHYSQSEEYKEKYKQTNLERYGVEYPLQSEEFKEKSKQVCLEKYGVEYYSQTDEYKEKFFSTMEEKHGGIGLASKEIGDRIRATNLERYGVEYPMQSDDIQAKALHTVKEKYKVDNFWKSEAHLKDIIKDPEKASAYYEFKADPRAYIESHYSYKPTVNILCEDLGVTDTPVYDVLINHNCKDAVDRSKGQSSMELSMQMFLESLVPREEIRMNDRKQISPKELDFYLPNYNFAIECNPTVTHNSTVSAWSDADPIPHNYHQIKSIEAANKGIFLMHVFSYEWVHKRPIIMSMIANALGKNEFKVYARNTKVIEVSASQAKEFLNTNHRQGYSPGKIKLGLVAKDTGELVSLMTFGLTRPAIGKQDEDDDSTYELIRFCSKLNTNVVGGASKLFKHFLKTFNPNKVISFSDVAHTRGKLYGNLGFHEVSRSDPGYVWVKPYGEEYRNRVSCQKQFLPAVFDDVDETTIQEKSEREIMIEHKYVQVFDSGVIRWEYTPDNR